MQKKYSIKQTLIPLDQPTRWQAALKNLPFLPSHTHTYCQAFQRYSQHTLFLYHADDGCHTAVCPIAVRSHQGQHDVYTPYGNNGFIASGPIHNFMNHWMTFCKDAGFICGYINLNNLYPAANCFFNTAVSRKKMFFIDLTQPIDQIRQSLGRNNRRLLRRWAEQNFTLCFNQARLKTAFLSIYPDFVKRIQASEQYYFDHAFLAALSNWENAYFIGVEENHDISFVRCHLFTPHGADAFLEAYRPTAQVHSRRVYWEAVEHFKSQNIPYLYLGGGIAAGDSLEHYKASLSNQVSTQKTLKCIFNPDQYHRLCENASSHSDFFPAYHFG